MGQLLLGQVMADHDAFVDRPAEAAPQVEQGLGDAAGDVGFFAPKSIWPFWAAVTVSVILLGPALHQAWISLLGVALGIWSCSGWVLEFYRGDYKH